MKFKATRYIPQNSRPFKCDNPNVAIYLYESNGLNGLHYLAIAYSGKRNKPDFHYTYKTAAKRAQSIHQYLDRQAFAHKTHGEMLAQRKAEHATPHTLQVGDILCASWGYDQTNIDYYEVTRVVGPHSVEIREIGQARYETGWAQGKCSPQTGLFIGEPMIKRADKNNTVKVRDWGVWAHKVDKLDVSHYTEYA